MKRTILNPPKSDNIVKSAAGRGQTREQADAHIAKAETKRQAKAFDRLAKLSRDTRAVTALEYGIIAGVLGLVLIATFVHFGSKLSGLFSTIGKSI